MPVLKIKKTDGTWQEVWGALSSSSVSEEIIPKLTSINIPASDWNGTSSPYSQVVECSCVNVNSKIDLQPTPAQIVELQNAEISLIAANNNGVVTVYAVGDKPTSDYVIDALITEVAIV